MAAGNLSGGKILRRKIVGGRQRNAVYLTPSRRVALNAVSTPTVEEKGTSAKEDTNDNDYEDNTEDGKMTPFSNSNKNIETVLECLMNVKGRGVSGLSEETQMALDDAVAKLEREATTTGIANPTASPLLEGRWRLLYTSRPGTASPIQRTFTGVESFSVFQEISFPKGLDGQTPKVTNVVDFGGAGTLRVEAEASTDNCPLPNFTPRKGKGLPFGILGVSSVEPPARKNLRVDFQFTKAAFYFKILPFTIPYPVPFQLLNDERKGWIDITFMNKEGTFRLTRGNKGTLFILVKDDPPLKKLLDTIKSKKRSDDEIETCIESLIAENSGINAPAKSQVALGAWRLLWTKQAKNANPLQRALAGQVKNWQIISSKGSRVENRVSILPGFRVRGLADSKAEGLDRTRVDINEVFIELGPFRFDLPVRGENGFIDWLYLDEDIRITRGSKGSIFVHRRDQSVEY